MVRDSRTRRPGIILIDPWFIADDNGRTVLESAVQDLPRWVLPLLILDQPDDASTQKFADQVREILNAAGALPTDTSRRGAIGVSSFDSFVSIVRDLAVQAERQYLRYRSGRYQGRRVESPPSSDRPRSRLPVEHDGQGRPAQSPDPLGEKKPDA